MRNAYELLENADIVRLRPGDPIYLGHGWDLIVGVVHGTAGSTLLSHTTQQSAVRVMSNASGWTYRLRGSQQ